MRPRRGVSRTLRVLKRAARAAAVSRGASSVVVSKTKTLVQEVKAMTLTLELVGDDGVDDGFVGVLVGMGGEGTSFLECFLVNVVDVSIDDSIDVLESDGGDGDEVFDGLGDIR